MRLTTIFNRIRSIRPARQSARRFHARRRSTHSAMIEQMEDRTLLAATILGSFVSDIESGIATDVRLTIAQTQSETTAYSINVRPTNGSALDVGALTLRELNGAAVSAISEDNSLSGGLESSGRFNLAPGSYIVGITGENTTAGDFTVEVSLLGSTGGKSGITAGDVQLAAASMLSQTSTVARDLHLQTPIYQSVGYMSDFDIDNDGVVDADDLNFIQTAASMGGTSSVSFTINNDAPVLDASEDLQLDPVQETVAASINGNLVSEILASGTSGNPITDSNVGDLEGIAVIDVNNDNGVWQFDANGGTNYTNFVGVAPETATLLSADARVRFLPNPNFIIDGTGPVIDFEFRAWDQTSGTNGQTGVDSRVNGGSTAFSINTSDARVDVDPLALALNTSANNTTPTNGGIIVQNAAFNIGGVADANATIEVSLDGDGVFDDGTALADESGIFDVNVTLVHNDTNRGANTVVVRSIGSNTGLFAQETLEVHLAVGTVARFGTTLEIDGQSQTFDLELFDQDTPLTVAKFLQLSEDGEYRNSIVHRSLSSNFIIQGGGFAVLPTTTPTQVQAVNAGATVVNEGSTTRSNVRGTISTALSGGNVDSFDSQWFINTIDNSQLDQINANGGHTVFGVVIGSGMDVVDAIEALPSFNVTGETGQFALTDVPLVNYSGTGTPTEANYVQLDIAPILAPNP